MAVKSEKIDEFVGRKLRYIREKNGMSQKDLGKILNISYQQIQKYETAKNRLNVRKLIQISEFYKVPIQYFLPENEYHYEEDRHLKHLIKIWSGLNDNQKEIFVELAKDLRNSAKRKR